MPTPAVSVLIPTYDSQRYLIPTVESVLSQTEKDFELVFCDDGSTDSTMDMLAALAARDERIRVYRNEHNLGLHGNLVHLMHLARGKYVKFLMADDLLLPDALARLRAGLEDNPTVTVSTSRRLRIDGNGNQLPDTAHLQPPVAVTSVIDGHELGNTLLERQVNLVGEPSTVMFRRSDVDPDDMFVLRGARYGTLVDMVLWIKLLSRGGCHYVTEPLSCYRQHDEQLGVASGSQIADRMEWMQLLLDAPLLGYLQDPDQEARALHHRIMDTMCQSVVDPSAGQQLLLQQTQRLIDRLAELHRQRRPRAAAEAEQARARIAGDSEAIAREVAITRHGNPIPIQRAADLQTGNRPSLSFALAVVNGGDRALSTLRSVRRQALPDMEVLLLVPGEVTPDAQLSEFGPVSVVAVNGLDAENVWLQALESSAGDVVLFMSDDLELGPESLNSLMDQVLSAPQTIASPLVVGAHGTGISGDLGSLSTVCLAGRRASLLGEDPLDLVPVSSARAVAR